MGPPNLQSGFHVMADLVQWISFLFFDGSLPLQSTVKHLLKPVNKFIKSQSANQINNFRENEEHSPL